MEDRVVGKHIYIFCLMIQYSDNQYKCIPFLVNISEKQHSAKLITLANIIAFQVHSAEPPPGVTA